ncbi:hypothetical protein [Arthrobacter sp. 2YAF22_2]|uniref:hypothetical protein n=1 Tax=Arthrobacter sp. 2YAF22_2 TaxID=3233029 RepID=UPI003F8F339F
MALNKTARPLTVTVLLATMALTGRSAPVAAKPTSTADAATATADAATATADAATAPASATPSPTKSSGPYGDFPTAAEACNTISEQATGASLLPLSAAQGKTAELEQYKAELSNTAERVPDSLKAAFAKLNQVAVAGLSDQTVFSSGKFQDAMAPVTGWLAANCK